MHIIKHSNGDVFAGFRNDGDEQHAKWSTPTESDFTVLIFAEPAQAEDTVTDMHLLCIASVADVRVVPLSSLSS